METDTEGALGVQKNETGETQFYCGEFKKRDEEERIVAVYNFKMGSSKFVRVESVCIGICRLCGQDRVMESIYCVCLNTPA